VKRAHAHGLEPFITISEAPAWAERPAGGRAGANNPDPVEVARFAQAMARRYGGDYRGLPRVRAFEVWNEVNASFFFMPQRSGETLLSPALYREMVNQVALAVHGVHADNLVIAGATFPFFVDTASVQAIGPLRFMRELFCLSPALQPVTGCGDAIRADVWSTHPYTQGSPTHRVGNPDSVSIGQLPRMRKVLAAASRYGRIASARPVQFWASEFGWDTDPPDPNGVPVRLHARWVSEALFRMWDAGISLESWFRLRDSDENFVSGLYTHCDRGIACDRPKLSLQAFRFPFVAFRSRGRTLVWGRVPPGHRASVVIERFRRGGWQKLRRFRPNSHGIFVERMRGPRRGSLRARLAGGSETSIPFSIKRPPDRPISPPVG
jgi:hypothetical protein